jgi:hypothetical protein
METSHLCPFEFEPKHLKIIGGFIKTIKDLLNQKSYNNAVYLFFGLHLGHASTAPAHQRTASSSKHEIYFSITQMTW